MTVMAIERLAFVQALRAAHDAGKTIRITLDDKSFHILRHPIQITDEGLEFPSHLTPVTRVTVKWDQITAVATA